MKNPVLVEVRRGHHVESKHSGAVAIVDADGALLSAIGDTEAPVFPRSAIKPLQALYVIESGAAEHFKWDDADIALCCASHNGEEAHVRGVTAMLEKAGHVSTCLECGAQWPTRHKDRAILMKVDASPTALHNNCSGKHAGFIAGAYHLGEKVSGYVKPDHPAQREIKAILEELYQVKMSDAMPMATDGCSIPTYAVPLRAIARAFAIFGSKAGLTQTRAQSAEHIIRSCITHPHLVAGEKRFDTEIMQVLGTSVLVKTGAEGVYAGYLPDLGLGVALKCDDGATRASEVMMATVLSALLPERNKALKPFENPVIKNRNGWHVGSIAPVADFKEKVAELARS